MNARPQPHRRSDYRFFDRITTRWMDNDSYRHVNNVTYYSYFDTAVSRLLITGGVLDIARSPVVGLVVETQCRYFSPIAFPDDVHAGVRVGRLGTSSVTYEVGLFRNDADAASAQGHFTHVYVARESSRPTPLPDALRALLQPLLVGPG